MPRAFRTVTVVYEYDELDADIQEKARTNLYHYLKEQWFEYEIPDLVHNYWFCKDGSVFDER